MTNLAEYTPSSEVPPPTWLPPHLTQYFVPTASDALSIAGPYLEDELWMLENHVRDMQRWRSEFVIAPMEDKGAVGTYRLGAKKGRRKP